MRSVHPPPGHIITRAQISPRGDPVRGDDSNDGRVDAQRRIGSEIRTMVSRLQSGFTAGTS
jgi:hypothetical protein